jgi:hypothetical protein
MELPTYLKVFFNQEMFLSKGRTRTKNGTETEGRANWGTAPPEDTSCLQTPNPTLLLWLKVPFGEEPSVAVPVEVRQATDQCRGGCLEPTIRLNSRNLVGKLAEGLEEQRGIGRTTLAGLTTQFSQRLDHQPRSAPNGIFGSR